MVQKEHTHLREEEQWQRGKKSEIKTRHIYSDTGTQSKESEGKKEQMQVSEIKQCV